MHRLQELVRLHRLGKNCRETARLLTMGPNTERRYRQALQAAGLLDGEPGQLPELRVLKLAVERFAPAKPAPQQASSIERWRDQIAELVDDGLGAQAVFDRLRLEQDDFKGSIGAVKRMVRRLGRERGVQPEDVAIPVETDPGDVAQVDFGYAGRLWDPDTGRVRKAWVFVMVLGYSRHLVARLVFDQRTETWLRLHVEAFAELGGVARTLVPDNLKAAVIRAAFGVDGPTALNRSYQELARHYGFTVDPTPPRAPKKKGKVEAGVKYVKRNFLRGRDGADISELRPQLDRWVNEIAGQRIHGTTGKRPLEVFEQEERTSLMPLPLARFEPVLWKQAKVHRDSHFIFERRLYSVPWRLIGQQIWVRATSSTVMAYADDERVATHPRSGRRYRSTIERHLPEQRAALRHRSRQYWEERADRMGPEVGRYIREVFDSDEVLSQLRTVQAIVTHLEGFPRHRAVAACRRARFFANYSYPGIRNILKRALDLEALPNERMAEVSWPTPPRFARDLRELAITGRGGQA